MLTEMRKDIRHHLATLTARSKLEWRLHQVADSVLKEASRVFELRVEFTDRLAVPLRELRSIIPGINRTGSAVDKDPDDSLGFRIKMPRLRR